MTVILGISALDHRSAAALVMDGRLVAAHVDRHAGGRHPIPVEAIQQCLDRGHLSIADVHQVGFHDLRAAQYERLVDRGFSWASGGVKDFVKSLSPAARTMRKHFARFRADVRDLSSESASGAAWAFHTSPFDEAAILDFDHVPTSITIGRDGLLQSANPLRTNHSIRALFAAFGHFCGLGPNARADRLRRVARNGRPSYVEALLENVIRLQPDGSYKLHPSYFHVSDGALRGTRKLHQLLGGEPRSTSGPIEQRIRNIACSVFVIVGEFVRRAAFQAHTVSTSNQLCLTSDIGFGSALRDVLCETPFERVWIQPEPGALASALSAACYLGARSGKLDDSEFTYEAGVLWDLRTGAQDERAGDPESPELPDFAPEFEVPLEFEEDSATEADLDAPRTPGRVLEPQLELREPVARSERELPKKSIPLGRPLTADELPPEVEEYGREFKVFEPGEHDDYVPQPHEPAREAPAERPAPRAVPEPELAPTEAPLRVEPVKKPTFRIVRDLAAPVAIESSVVEAPVETQAETQAETPPEDLGIDPEVFELLNRLEPQRLEASEGRALELECAPVLEDLTAPVEIDLEPQVELDLESPFETAFDEVGELELAEAELFRLAAPEIYVPKLLLPSGHDEDDFTAPALLSPCCAVELDDRTCSACGAAYGNNVPIALHTSDFWNEFCERFRYLHAS